MTSGCWSMLALTVDIEKVSSALPLMEDISAPQVVLIPPVCILSLPLGCVDRLRVVRREELLDRHSIVLPTRANKRSS